MQTTELSDFLMWCFIFNAGLFFFWFVAFLCAKDQIHGIHSRWFAISKEQFAAINYRLMGQYKLAIVMLNLVPWIALLVLAD
jgi:hypothetical protein